MMPRLLILISCLLTAAFGGQERPYLDFNKAGAGFYGDSRDLPEPAGLSSVRIGVLGPAKSREGLHQRAAVQIALEDANRRGGYRYRPAGEQAKDAVEGEKSEARFLPYEMIFREDDGPWGTASKQVVSLVYEDKVWAIIGGLDGLHTHLAELIVSKAWVPVISPTAVDSSIAYANVPWVFRAAPADSSQAEALLSLAEKKGFKHLVVMTELDRDSQTGWKRLNEIAGRRHSPIELHIEYTAANPEENLDRLKSIPMDALIVWGKSQPALRLLLAMRKARIDVPVLGNSELATVEAAANAAQAGDLTVASLCELQGGSPDFQAFRVKFEKLTGQAPSATALFCYDTARLLIAAIERGGLNRARIRDRLAETRFEGLTGSIAFNMLGSNEAGPVLLKLAGNGWGKLN